MVDAWTTTYIGNFHEILLDNINEMPRGSAYANFVPIIQSSGTGKSRMVHELAGLVFTIPFNIRAAEDQKG